MRSYMDCYLVLEEVKRDLHALKAAGVTSADGLPEIAAESGAFPVATGSSPVSSAEVLSVAGVLEALQTNNARHRLCYRRAAEILRHAVAKQEADEITALMARRCAEAGITFEEGIRRLAGLPKKRQPGTNKQGSETRKARSL